MNTSDRTAQITYFAAGAAVSTLSWLLFFFLGQQLDSPQWTRPLLKLISGLPWIMVAVVIGLWRFKGPKIRVLAYLLGTFVSMAAFIAVLYIRMKTQA